MRAAGLPRRLLTPITPGAKRSVVVLFVLTLALSGANLFWTSNQVGHVSGVVRTQDAEVRKLGTTVLASCAFARDVGSAPAPAGKPSKLGISLIADSRQQWRELGCPGHLPPPTPAFAQWARFYHLPAT